MSLFTFKEMWKDIPTFMRVAWIIGGMATIAFWCFVIWVIVKLLNHFEVI